MAQCTSKNQIDTTADIIANLFKGEVQRSTTIILVQCISCTQYSLNTQHINKLTQYSMLRPYLDPDPESEPDETTLFLLPTTSSSLSLLPKQQQQPMVSVITRGAQIETCYWQTSNYSEKCFAIIILFYHINATAS